MFIINPLNGHGADNLFSTHPSTANRVAALLQLDVGGGGIPVTEQARPYAAAKRGRGPWDRSQPSAAPRGSVPRSGPWGR
jgi:heat shock protein HtpX